MRARTFKIVAPSIVVLQVCLIVGVLVSTEIQQFLGKSTVVVWAVVLGLGLVAWGLIPSAKKTRWPAKKKPKPKPSAKSPAMSDPSPSPAAAAMPTRPGAVARTRRAVTDFADGAKGVAGAAVAIFGEKPVISAVLAVGAHFGVPSGTVMTVLNAVGIDKKVASQAHLENLQGKVGAARQGAERQQKEIVRIQGVISNLETAALTFDTRLKRVEEISSKPESNRIHVEILDRRAPPNAEKPPEVKPPAQADLSDLLGKAIFATSHYWRGQYCAAARDLTSLTTAVKPLPATIANLKGQWLWRLGDLVGAEKCFAYGYKIALPARSEPHGRDAVRYGLMGLAQNYCMRRNYCEVFKSKRHAAQMQNYERLGLSCEAVNDQHLAEATLHIGLSKDAGFKDILQKEVQAQTEFARLCSLAIEQVLDPSYSPNLKLKKVVEDRLSELQTARVACGAHAPLNCPLDNSKPKGEGTELSKLP